MSPQELSTYLRSMASYIEGTPNPSQRAIIAGIQRAMREVGKTGVHYSWAFTDKAIQAGKVTKFVDKDYSAAMHGLDSLIERLTKAAKSLNPQNEAKASLEHSVSKLQSLKAGLSEEFQELARVDI